MPNLAIAQMTRQDQIDVTVNQATASVICCYLEHKNTSITKGAPGDHDISPAELLNLINTVQTALRTVA